MTHQRSEDEGFSADRALIEALAKGLGLDRWPGDADTLVELGDMENTCILARRHGTFTFETTSRGQRSIKAAFGSARDARRYMIMDLCEAYRFRTLLPPVVMNRLAAGSQLEDGPTGHRLTWPGGEATFSSRDQAVGFSWAINAEPDLIVASYQHVNGEPSFDLGIPVDEWRIHTARRRPVGRVTQPRVETPPPDDEDAADRAAIDAVLADLRWERRAPSGADVLAVGDRYQGRAIAYRQSQFVYESTAGSGRYRDARGRTHRDRAHVVRRPGHLPHRRQGIQGRAELQLGRHGRTRGHHRQLPPPERGTALRSAPGFTATRQLGPQQAVRTKW
jgi:hypothetical protein